MARSIEKRLLSWRIKALERQKKLKALQKSYAELAESRDKWKAKAQGYKLANLRLEPENKVLKKS